MCFQSCYDGSGPCTGESAVVLLNPTPLITFYADEPQVSFLRSRLGEVDDTLTFQTQLDTLFEEEDGSDIDCGWCYAHYEKVVLRFMNEEAENMQFTFLPCDKFQALIEGRQYRSGYYHRYSISSGDDTLLFNDSLGFHYYARGFGFQLKSIR